MGKIVGLYWTCGCQREKPLEVIHKNPSPEGMDFHKGTTQYILKRGQRVYNPRKGECFGQRRGCWVQVTSQSVTSVCRWRKTPRLPGTACMSKMEGNRSDCFCQKFTRLHGSANCCVSLALSGHKNLKFSSKWAAESGTGRLVPIYSLEPQREHSGGLLALQVCLSDLFLPPWFPLSPPNVLLSLNRIRRRRLPILPH